MESDLLKARDHQPLARLNGMNERGRIEQGLRSAGIKPCRSAAEKMNIDVVDTICALLDELRPDPAGPHARLKTFVTDRPGHDLRYAMDFSKLTRELGWQPAESFESGLRRTVDWYLANTAWCQAVEGRGYSRERLGLSKS